MNTKTFLKTALGCCIAATLYGCGSDDKDDVINTAKVSFSIADAPVENAQEVNVTYKSITLTREDEEDIELLLTNEEGEETPVQINLLDYQNGDSLLVLSEAELPIGEYKELIINTDGCAENNGPNQPTDACNVVDDEGTHPLKTPSNKLKLGSFTVTTEATQAYTIDFNLRKSLVETGNGYNLKPHGVTIVDSEAIGSIFGSVDENLFAAGENCEADTGNVVYLYPQATLAEGEVLGDEFDPELANAPDNVVAPLASKMIEVGEESGIYTYSFNFIPAGEYLMAFSCSAVNDDPETYDEITIADPAEQVKESITLAEGENLEIDFVEIVQ
ncbi:DUF4382 domain-containing protein [Shewanella gaetbuli]|uniref:DUF4382 domain-containing protein n=1 Tax=Shewanella gaetbuli TaxID=220752 RepID=A0A9X1ZLC0_9GAMM|nr:DUF4382 domain-containing protein [Shewanella gaetbuli]MCL1141975.1 DUF4382 domain-containing protein [Shewanella gaetbuli]